MRQQKQITSAQLKLIHTLLSQQKLMKRKPDLCLGFSEGRTESSRELTFKEAKDFIQYLKNDEERSNIIKRIWYLAYQSGIIYGETAEDKAINAGKLNIFVKERGAVKKSLSDQNITELKRTVRQFEAIFRKTEEKQAVTDFIRLMDYYNQELVKAESYEAAAHNQSLIKQIKADPKLATQFFGRQPEKKELAEKLRIQEYY